MLCCWVSEEQQQLERMLMQQWRELPQEMTGRRKNAKKTDDGDVAVPVDALMGARSAVVEDGSTVEGDLFCEACRKWFKSEQQMQQHVASKKHKERLQEWEDLLAASCADAGADDEEPGSKPTVFAAAAADDSDEEFEAQLQRMHVGGGEHQIDVDADVDENIESGCASVGDGSGSGLDDEEEASLNVGKKKKKKKVKRGVMVDAMLSQEAVAEAAVPDAVRDGGDEDEGEGDPTPGKKLTKKQIRRYFCPSFFM
jgi:hypothetical protein